MLYLKREREIDPSHSSFSLYKFDEVPSVEYINLSVADKLYVEANGFNGYSRVIAKYGETNENVFVAYSERDADIALEVIMNCLRETNEKFSYVTGHDIARIAEIDHVKNLYGTDAYEVAVLARG